LPVYLLRDNGEFLRRVFIKKILLLWYTWLMPIIADLHIHSRYSRATSSRLTPAYLDRWARIKGIGLLGSGDCTHPQWLSELRQNLDDAEPGLFTLKDAVRAEFDGGAARMEELPLPEKAEITPNVPRFALSGEISTIYKRDGKTRKVHHLVLLPDFRAAAAFQAKLERTGNIASDGRPILGLDSRDLFSMLLDADERSLLVPAHIWTPWFSALGAKSGFDSIGECYGSLVSRIPAVETGLSSDPPMNWALSSLDGFSIISNSDAHSPDKLGREATIFDMEFSFHSLCAAMRGGVLATIEFFPEEGKYHYDGHRKCGICLGPEETAAKKDKMTANGEIPCPVCGKPLTRGVMGRVLELADRPLAETAASAKTGNRRPFYPLIPLRELLGELLGTGSASKKVDAAYFGLIEKAGSEFRLLMEMDISAVGRLSARGVSGEILAAAIGRMRQGEVSISPGYDGEYGVVRLFAPGAATESGGDLFDEVEPKPPVRRRNAVKSDVPAKAGILPSQADRKKSGNGEQNTAGFTFDSAQEALVNFDGPQALVIAGPGSGKTAVLAARIARVIEQGAQAPSILALSFTVKAAAELRERIGRLAGGRGGEVTAATFHSFCCSLLREQAGEAGLSPDFGIIGETERNALLRELCKGAGKKNKITSNKLGRYIEERKRFLLLPGERRSKTADMFDDTDDMPPVPEPVPEMESLYTLYRSRLRADGLLDYDDLVAGTVRLFLAKETILAGYRRRYRRIFVDEYQDINLCQYALLRLLADGGENEAPSIWAIGDPNQAIYGFRGSDKRFIDRFQRDYPNARRFELVKSFRCAGPIISAAALLAGSPLRGIACPVDLYRCEYPSDKSEAEGVARAISRLIGGASFFAMDSNDADDDACRDSSSYEATAAPCDCAVLIRAAPLAAPIAKALQDHGIPCNVTGGQPWWEDEPFKSFLIRVRESAKPETVFQTEKENPALKRLFETEKFFGNVQSLLDALVFSDSGGLPEIKREGVNIMTMHASKGLEFDHVFVIALEDGLVPFTLYDAEGAEHREEERRLLYVAMTRARLGLHLSWAHSRNFKGRKLEGGASPFLGELEQIIPLARGKKAPRKDRQLALFL
jgi:uncharacterized protein (TIGR00375 family)